MRRFRRKFLHIVWLFRKHIPEVVVYVTGIFGLLFAMAVGEAGAMFWWLGGSLTTIMMMVLTDHMKVA